MNTLLYFLPYKVHSKALVFSKNNSASGNPEHLMGGLVLVVLVMSNQFRDVQGPLPNCNCNCNTLLNMDHSLMVALECGVCNSAKNTAKQA